MTRKLDFDDTLPQDKNTDELAIPSHVIRSSKLFMWLFIALPMGLYALVVFFAPLDVLEQLPRVRRWADGVHAALLTFSRNVDIYKHARSTGFPEVAMLASALAVSIVAVIAITGAVRSAWTAKYHAVIVRLNSHHGGNVLVEFLVLPPLGMGMMWAFYCLGGDPGFATGYTTQGRVGYWFISSIAILFCGGGLLIWAAAVLRFFFDIFSKDKS